MTIFWGGEAGKEQVEQSSLCPHNRNIFVYTVVTVLNTLFMSLLTTVFLTGGI